MIWLLEYLDENRNKDIYQRLLYDAIVRLQIVRKYIQNDDDRYGFQQTLQDVEVVWSQCLKNNILININTKFE